MNRIFIHPEIGIGPLLSANSESELVGIDGTISRESLDLKAMSHINNTFIPAFLSVGGRIQFFGRWTL